MGIRVLDHDIAHKLRIGIPLTVVAAIRVLLHNAYDARATSIQVVLSGNGLDSIEVTDNGHRISEDDCKRIAIPYSTSKISTNEDLGKLGGKTLGFRGLDLARLAQQCSSMKITTLPDTCSLAFVVKLKGHPSIRDVTTGHHNRGTTVTVKDLFSTYPVRHEQASKSKTFMKEIIDMLTASALARPSNCLPNPALDAAVLVFGPQVSRQGDLIHQNANGYTIDACLIRSGGHNKPFITVDGRPISRTKGIAQKLIKCYQRQMRLGDGSLRDNSSWWYLEIRCPEASYDVNVDPEKDDLVFAESATVERLWESALEGSIVKAQDSSVKAKRAEVRRSKSQANVAGRPPGPPSTLHEMSSAPRTGQLNQEKSLVGRRTPFELPAHEERSQTEEDRTEKRSKGASSDPVSSNPDPLIVLDNDS